MPGPFKPHAVAVLNKDRASDEKRKEQLLGLPKPCSAAPVMERNVHVPF